MSCWELPAGAVDDAEAMLTWATLALEAAHRTPGPVRQRAR